MTDAIELSTPFWSEPARRLAMTDGRVAHVHPIGATMTRYSHDQSSAASTVDRVTWRVVAHKRVARCPGDHIGAWSEALEAIEVDEYPITSLVLGQSTVYRTAVGEFVQP